jgi:hypothetical protein
LIKARFGELFFLIRALDAGTLGPPRFCRGSFCGGISDIGHAYRQCRLALREMMVRHYVT